MGFEQAFHTSCRSGLGNQPGFQFNAASGGLSPSDLAELAGSHAGYTPPADGIQQPRRDQLTSFPISLKYLPVDGLGPVVSRTAYVGREYRGHGDATDSGRYGNYFSHILVQQEGEGQLFQHLLPIELWEAPFWTTDEVREPRVPPISALDTGTIEPVAAFHALCEIPAPIVGRFLDCVLGSVLGGARTVVVDARVDRLHAWVVLASFALPRHFLRDLTFSTYSGTATRESVALTVTMPACDLSFAPYELSSSVEVVRVGEPTSHEPELYGRVAVDLLASNPAEAFEMIGGLPRNSGTERYGAELALAARRPSAVNIGDRVPLLDTAGELIDRDEAGELAAVLEAFDEARSLEEAEAWLRLFNRARNTANGEPLVDLSLARAAARLPDTAVGATDGEPITDPSVSSLAAWLDSLTELDDPERLHASVDRGLALGLFGLNEALDSRVGELLIDSWIPSRTPTLIGNAVTLSGDAMARAVARRAVALLEAGELQAHDLAAIAKVQGCRGAIAQCAQESESFDVLLAWELIELGNDVEKRSRSLERLARAAATPEHHKSLAGLFGPRGPQALEDFVELVEAYRHAGCHLPSSHTRRALEILSETSPLKDRRAGVTLVNALHGARADMDRSLTYQYWWAVAGRIDDLGRWASDIEAISGGLKDLPKKREADLRTVAARRLLKAIDQDNADVAYKKLDAVFGKAWAKTFASELKDGMASGAASVPLIAETFITTFRAAGERFDFAAEVVPRTLGKVKERDLQKISDQMGKYRAAWEKFLDEHPPRSGLGRRSSKGHGRGR